MWQLKMAQNTIILHAEPFIRIIAVYWHKKNEPPYNQVQGVGFFKTQDQKSTIHNANAMYKNIQIKLKNGGIKHVKGQLIPQNVISYNFFIHKTVSDIGFQRTITEESTGQSCDFSSLNNRESIASFIELLKHNKELFIKAIQKAGRINHQKSLF